MIIILISILFSVILLSLHIIDKRINKINDEIETIYDSLYLRIDNLLLSVMDIRMDLEQCKKIWKTQMRPNTHMMDTQNIKEDQNNDLEKHWEDYWKKREERNLISISNAIVRTKNATY